MRETRGLSEGVARAATDRTRGRQRDRLRRFSVKKSSRKLFRGENFRNVLNGIIRSRGSISVLMAKHVYQSQKWLHVINRVILKLGSRYGTVGTIFCPDYLAL